MSDSSNALLQIESSVTAVAMVELTDQGDHTAFDSADELWSKQAGYTPDVKPNGVLSGCGLSPGTSNTISLAAGKINLNGVETTITAAANQAVARPTLAYCTYSITINSSGAFAAVSGVESAVGLSTTRGADGGPPLVAVDSVEIGQVWISSASSGVYTAAEIKQVHNVSQERALYPTYEKRYGIATNGVLGYAGVDFTAALPLIHTGSVPKKVYASYYTPEFADIPTTADFVPPETTHSTSSTQVYGRTIGASSESLNQGSFTAYLDDGISDGVISLKNSFLWFKFFQNRLDSNYVLAHGKFGISRTFPAADEVKAACTISATEAAAEVVG